MIREQLKAAIKESFPELPFSFSDSANLMATLQPPCAEIGMLQIYDDGDEATVDISEVTHGHFNPYDVSLNEEQRERQIVKDVISFLRALFADKVLLFRTPNRSVGGWRRLDLSLHTFESGYEYFLWSGPYDANKGT